MSDKPFSSEIDRTRRGLLAAAASVGVAASVSQVSGATLSANGFKPGFDLAEALDVLQMCEVIEDGPPTPPVAPTGWSIIYDSPQLPVFDNKWQLWKKSDGTYAIIVRGTVETVGSAAEDLLSVLIKADDKLTVGSLTLPYKFANATDAAVHAGFALGALLILKTPIVGVFDQLKKLGAPAGTRFLIGGHSQGAAVATLIRSYLNYGVDSPQGNCYKTYLFAQPKPGNDHYACDFENLFSNPGLAFRLTNSIDWVPQVPFTLQIPNDVSKPNPLFPDAVGIALNNFQVQVGQLLAAQQSARLQKGAAAAMRTKFSQVTDTTAIKIPLVFSLNFTGAGTEVALIGKPCNPLVDQCDYWFQHHLTTYEALMKAQLKPVPVV